MPPEKLTPTTARSGSSKRALLVRLLVPVVMVGALTAIVYFGTAKGRSVSRIEQAIIAQDSDEAIRLLQTYTIDLDTRVVVYGPDPDQTLLHLAARHDMPDVIDALIAAGADIENDTNMDDLRPIHMAVHGDAHRALQALIDAGAELDPQDEGSCTPLLSCVIGDDLEGARLLIAAGADANFRWSDGRGTLHWSKSEAMTQLLLGAGAVPREMPAP